MDDFDDFSLSDEQPVDVPKKRPGRPPKETPLRVRGRRPEPRVPHLDKEHERRSGPGPGAGAKSAAPSPPPPPRAPGGTVML